jgi:Arc/MetJ-type ribon-helix-helix transcriptional regulator
MSAFYISSLGLGKISIKKGGICRKSPRRKAEPNLFITTSIHLLPYRGTCGHALLGERLKLFVNSIVYGDLVTQVQLRLSEKTLEELDKWVAEGRFKSRSDAIRIMLNYYLEREKTREFYKMLVTRSEEAKKHPEALIPIEEL